MEPRFEVRTVTDKELMTHLAKYALKNPRRRILTVLVVCMGLLLFYMYGSYLDPWIIRWAFSADNPNGVSSFIVYWIFLLFGVFFLLYPLYVFHMMRLKFWRVYRHRAGEVNAHAFFEDHFTSETKGVSSVMQYESLFEVIETKEVFCIKSTKAHGAVLPKTSFTTGSPDDFRAFIEEKTGKKIRFIR